MTLPMDEQEKQRLQLAGALFGLTAGIYLLVAYFMGWIVYFGDFSLQALIGAGIGLAIGGAAYALAPKG